MTTAKNGVEILQSEFSPLATGLAILFNCENRGLSQQDLVTEMNGRGVSMTPSTLGRRIAGKKHLKVHEAIAICEVFGIKVSDFITQATELERSGHVAAVRQAQERMNDAKKLAAAHTHSAIGRGNDL